MFFHLQILLWSMLYAAALELSVWKSDWLYVNGMLVMLAALLALRNADRHNPKLMGILAPLSVSSVLLIYLIDTFAQRQIFITISALVFYVALLGIFRLKAYQKDQTARGLLAAALMAAFFIFLCSFYGFYLNFSIYLWFLMALFFAVTAGMSYAYFAIMQPDHSELRTFSLIVGMVMAEIAWIITFWPFGYLTTGAVVLIFYFLFWDLTQRHFTNNLSQKSLILNLALFAAVAAVILSTSRWLPVV